MLSFSTSHNLYRGASPWLICSQKTLFHCLHNSSPDIFFSFLFILILFSFSPLCCLLVLAGCIGGEWPRLCPLPLIRLCLFRQTIKIILSYICVWLSLSLFLGFYSSFGRFYRGPGCTGGKYSAFSRRPADLINPSLSFIGFRASNLPPPGSAFPLVRTSNYSNINTKLPHIFWLQIVPQ